MSKWFGSRSKLLKFERSQELLNKITMNMPESKSIFQFLESIHSRPKPFEFYTAESLWNDEHTSKHMLQFHLNENLDVSSRNAKFIEKSAEWMRENFQLDETKRIVDFGCGPGLYTSRFAQTGARVTGIDFSKNSINYAREFAEKNELNINYINQNYLDFKTNDKFDLITMIMCDFCALSPEQRNKLLQKFLELLKPEGRILLDVYTLEGYRKREVENSFAKNMMDGFWSSETYYGFLQICKYDQEKVVLDHFTLIEEKRIRTVYNWLQYFSQEALCNEFNNNHFEIEQFYSDVAGSPFDPNHTEMAIVVRRKSFKSQ